MKLLRELLSLHSIKLAEDEIEIVEAADVWEAQKKLAKIYVAKTLYLVKKVPNIDKYEVYTEANNTKKLFATLSDVDLNSSFIPVQADQDPDVEGYLTYRNSEEIEAFQYQDGTVNVKLILDDETLHILNKDDYMSRKVDGDNFVYSIEPSSIFDIEFIAK